MISALAIYLSIWELSTEKLSWDDWHGYMKDCAEVANNIERQDTERGSEEINSCMRRFPVIKIMETVVLGLWPAGNI